jgi:hypothetical protein
MRTKCAMSFCYRCLCSLNQITKVFKNYWITHIQEHKRKFICLSVIYAVIILDELSKREDDNPDIVEHFIKKFDKETEHGSKLAVRLMIRKYIEMKYSKTAIYTIDYILQKTKEYIDEYIHDAQYYDNQEVLQFLMEKKKIMQEKNRTPFSTLRRICSFRKKTA